MVGAPRASDSGLPLMHAIPMPDAHGTAGSTGAAGLGQLVLRSSATGRPYPTADRTAAVAYSTSC